MSTTVSQSPLSGSGASPARTSSLRRGLLIGFIPLGVLAVIVAATVVLTAGARALTSGQGFSAEQRATVLTLALGLALGFVLYSIAIAWVWRRMAAWRRIGAARRAMGALWALAITALIVLLPVILALIIPQHPAP